MQIQPDYSRQLEEIAKALNRPSMPQWEVALIAAVFGAFLGMAVQWLLKVLSKVLDNWWDIHTMRRVLYLDLLPMFRRVEDIMAFTELEGPELWDWQEEQLKPLLTFRGEAYLKAHQDIYMQLPERAAVESLYAVYHRILDDNRLRPVNSGRAKRLLAYLVEKNQLRRKYIKKFLSRAEAKELLKRLHFIYEDSEWLPPSGTTEPMDGK